MFSGLLASGAGHAVAEPLPAPLPEEVLPGLSGILQTALEQSPSMILKNIDVIQHESNRATVRSQLLPSAGVGASYSINGASAASSSDTVSRSSGVYYSASVSQTLFRWGTVRAQVEAAEIELNISRRNYAEAYRTLAVSLRGQYLSLIVKKLALRNTRYNQEVAAAALAVGEDNLRNGRIPESSVIAMRLQFEETTLQMDRAAEELAQSLRVFKRLAGLKEFAESELPDDIPAIAYDSAAAAAMLRGFLSRDWELNPLVVNGRDWVRYAELNYKSAKYRLYPMFGLGASLAQSNSTSAVGGVVSQASVLSQYAGVSMSWSIFDGFATRAAKINAKANIRLYERQLQTATDQVLDQAVGLERQAGFAYRSMNLAQSRADISASALRAVQEDARSGAASRIAVEAAQAVSNQYQITLQSQRADLLSRWAEFVSVIGRDPVVARASASEHAR